MTSSGRHLLVVVVSDEHDNQFDGFSLEYYSVPGRLEFLGVRGRRRGWGEGGRVGVVGE